MQDAHELAIFEAGISQPGEMAHLAGIIRPTVGVFTVLGDAHSAHFSSEKEKLDEKWQLFSGAARVVYCADQAPVHDFAVQRKDTPLLCWSASGHPASDVQLSYRHSRGQTQIDFSHEKYISTTAPAWAMNAYDTHKKWQLEIAPASDTPELLPEGPLEKGSIFVFDRIYYDYNDSEIRADATAELDALFAKMQENPGMRIEMIAHTDSRGQADYNLRLSVERAEAARRYLLKKGIDKSRIRAVGYGENQLRNHCRNGVECSEEEHAFNRRTEIRILAIE